MSEQYNAPTNNQLENQQSILSSEEKIKYLWILLCDWDNFIKDTASNLVNILYNDHLRVST